MLSTGHGSNFLAAAYIDASRRAERREQNVGAIVSRLFVALLILTSAIPSRSKSQAIKTPLETSIGLPSNSNRYLQPLFKGSIRGSLCHIG